MCTVRLTVPKHVRFPARGELGGLPLALAAGGGVRTRRLARLHGAVVDRVRLDPDAGIGCTTMIQRLNAITIAKKEKNNEEC